MEKHQEKAANLIEALPYIRRFNGKTFVIKCGGAAMTDPLQTKNIMQDIALLFLCGIRIIIVHGGGPDISAMCEQLNLPIQFVQGQRVTDHNTMEVVKMVLIGKNNFSLVSLLNTFGIKAVGMNGADANLLQANPAVNHEALGYVGKITAINTDVLDELLSQQFLPVIAPVAVDKNGTAYNVNADFTAAALAAAIRAEKLIMLTDVNGYYADKNDPSTKVQTINQQQLKLWLNETKITGGMLPKLQACLQAIEHGAASAHIINGTAKHSLLLEIFSNCGVGTMIANEEYLHAA